LNSSITKSGFGLELGTKTGAKRSVRESDELYSHIESITRLGQLRTKKNKDKSKFLLK
jgi:hypothetical protein